MQNNPIIIYQTKDGKVKIETHFEDETIWLTQKQIAALFDKDRSVIVKHIGNVFKEGELDQEVVCANFAHTTQHGAIEGKMQIKNVKHYNLDVIISVGYRVKSHQGVQFRKWATALIKEYLTKGFVLNDERFKSGNSMNYFNELQGRIREIRLSEKLFYQKIKDIYTTSVDYNSADKKTVDFFKLISIFKLGHNNAYYFVHY